MTNKPIIMNDIDVSDCEHFSRCDKECKAVWASPGYKQLHNLKCANSPNCYFKMYKRKEQKCTRLAEELDQVKTELNKRYKVEAENDELKNNLSFMEFVEARKEEEKRGRMYFEHFAEEITKYIDEIAVLCGLNTTATTLGKGSIEYWAILSSSITNKIKELQNNLSTFKTANEDKNAFLEQLGIMSTAEMRRVSHYTATLHKEISDLKNAKKELVEKLHCQKQACEEVFQKVSQMSTYYLVNGLNNASDTNIQNLLEDFGKVTKRLAELCDTNDSMLNEYGSANKATSRIEAQIEWLEEIEGLIQSIFDAFENDDKEQQLSYCKDISKQILDIINNAKEQE